MSGNTGLVNLGNTCYLNSCLQILSHIPELNNYLLHNNKYNDVIDNIITIEWIELYKLMWSNDCIISPKRFLYYSKDISLKKNMLFSGNDQNDSIEYFNFIIDCFHNSLNNTNNLKLNKSPNKIINDSIDLYEKTTNSIIHLLFTSFINYTYINSYSTTFEFNKIEPTFSIELSIPKILPITIENCLEYTYKPETMTDLWFDEKTNTNKPLIKHSRICYLPHILVIHLKRWDYSTLNKNNTLISYNDTLDLYPYTEFNEIHNCKYELFGIINHEGSVLGGHYYSYIKKNNTWICFNDSSISSVQNIINNNNYCLFYRKIK
jgi:ubiquitin carboxyl-terminal hydrolase 8